MIAAVLMNLHVGDSVPSGLVHKRNAPNHLRSGVSLVALLADSKGIPRFASNAGRSFNI
jgi:hypothetical protein